MCHYDGRTKPADIHMMFYVLPAGNPTMKFTCYVEWHLQQLDQAWYSNKLLSKLKILYLWKLSPALATPLFINFILLLLVIVFSFIYTHILDIFKKKLFIKAWKHSIHKWGYLIYSIHKRGYLIRFHIDHVHHCAIFFAFYTCRMYMCCIPPNWALIWIKSLKYVTCCWIRGGNYWCTRCKGR